MNIVRNTNAEGTETYRERSRIGSINHRIWSVFAPVSYLSRVSLVALLLLIGVSNGAWADQLSWGVASGVYNAGDGKWGGFTYKDRDWTFSLPNGVPNNVTFNRYCTKAATGKSWSVSVSSDNSNWTVVWSNNDNASSWKTENVPLSNYKNTKYLKFHYHGNFEVKFSEITVYELIEFGDPSATTIAFGDVYVDSNPTAKTSNVSWTNLAASVSGVSSPVTINTTSFGSIGSYGTQTLSFDLVTSTAQSVNQTVTISNNRNSTTKTINVTANIKKYDQDIKWDNENNLSTSIRVGKSRTETATAYYSSTSNKTDCPISYSSSNPDVLEVNASTGAMTAKAVGKATITAQAGNYKFNNASNSVTYTVKDRETPEYYFNGALIHEGDVLNLNVGETSGVVTSNNTERIISASSENVNVARFNTETNRIEATGEGSITLTLAQEATDDYQAGSRTVKVNVSLNTTTITTNVSEKTMEVGDSYDPALATTNNEVPMSITSTNEAVAVYEDGVIKAKGAGTDTITFAQAKTTKWAEGSKSIIVTVNKKDPNITISGVPATAWNTAIEPVITSANTDVNCPITIERISGEDRTARVFGNSIRVYDNNGQSAKFRVSQSGNDTYNAATKEFTIKAQAPNNHVTYSIGNVTLSKDKDQTFGFTGVPGTVTFTPSSNASADRDYKLHWATSVGASTNHFATYDKNNEGTKQTVAIDPSARALKVEFAGAWNMLSSTTGTFGNLTITERRGIEVGEIDNEGYYDFGSSFEVGNPATDRAIPIGWYSVPTTTVTSSNPGVFDVITETIDSRIDEFDPSTSITIRYHHKKVTEGDFDEATITLTSENGYTTSFKVKGKTNKKDQTLIWQDELTPISVGEIIPNPAIAPLALNYSIVSTTEEGVVEMDGTVLKTIKPGTVTLRVANDGDDMWNPISGDYTIKVTDLKVQRINWDQTFTRLTTSDADFDLTATAYEYINDEKVTIDARPVTYSSDNTSVVTIVGGKLHVVGVGTANLTASVAGVAGEYEPASITRNVKVRVRSTGCTPYVLSNASYALNTIETKELSLSGEPNQITFSALGERILGFPQSGPMHFAEYYNGQWHKLWSSNLKVDEEQSFGPITLNRNTTKVKFYTEFGATCYHTFRSTYVTKAKYLELDDVQGKTSTDVSFPAEETHLGQTYIKSVVVNYSNIFDMLYVNHTNPNFRITPTEIGQGCGENGRTTITIIYYAKEPIQESDVITITDEHGMSATINVQAEVSKSDQTIIWNPATELKTTDVVTFNATASSGLAVTYSLAEGDEEVAEVSENGELTIKTSGEIHVTASQEGSGLYNSIALEPVTMHISKVTPSVSVKPIASMVTLPCTLSASGLNVSEAVMLNDKSEAVSGSYAWVDNTAELSAGTQAYNVRFTPSNEAWYNDLTFPVEVTANKRNQVISWDFENNQTLLCSAIIPLNAIIKDAISGDILDKVLTYSSNNTACADIDNGELVIKQPGTVVVTVSRVEDNIYNAASINRTITFEKATPEITKLPKANSIYEQQWLHESALLNGVARSGEREVFGHFEWTTEDFQAVTIGTQEYDAVFIPANEACYNRVSCKVPMTILQIERVFLNNAGDNDWNNPSNWSNGFVPPISNVSVTIAENVVIDSEVHVGSMKIEEGTEVTIAVAGHLTVDGYQETSTGNYGNMVVKEGGELTLNSTFKVNDFSIEASQGQSGQVENPENLDIQGEAYMDIKISDNAVLDENQWYGFTVPFPVDANTGVERIRPDGTIESGIVRDWDYAIATYNSQRRASGLSGWREFSGIMTPGVFYFLGIDGQSRIYRFHKTATGAMVSNDEMELNAYPADDPGDANWNAVGNPTLRYAHASCPVEFVQVYDNNTGAYSAVNTNASTFVVGRPFFIQTGNGTLSLTAADGSHEAYYAPRRNQENKQNPIEVVLSTENDEACDNVFIRASEDATQDYVIGRDLVKLGTTTKKAQMWVNACGKKLCVREEVMRNNSANYSLNLYAPQDGEYNLNVENIPDGTELYLTYNGYAIWNLTYSPYTFDLSKGNTEGYGLKLLVNKVATGIEDVDGGEQNGVRKVLIDNTIYIVMPDGTLYDINGKKVQ